MCSILKLHSFWERERECGARLATPCQLARLGSSCKPATCRRRRRTSGHGLLRAAPPVKHDALPDLCLRRTTIFLQLRIICAISASLAKFILIGVIRLVLAPIHDQSAHRCARGYLSTFPKSTVREIKFSRSSQQIPK